MGTYGPPPKGSRPAPPSPMPPPKKEVQEVQKKIKKEVKDEGSWLLWLGLGFLLGDDI